MSNWFPLHAHSHLSLLDGLSKPEQMAARILECGYEGCALTDHGTLAGIPSFLKAMRDEKKLGKKLKAVVGCEFYLCRDEPAVKTSENRPLSHLCVVAKGQAGWKNLIRASSESNRADQFYWKPRLNLSRLGKLAGGEFIAFSGHMGSDLANVCFADHRVAYSARSYEEARELVHKDWRQRVMDEVVRYQDAFGKENFYLEIQLIDHKNLPASQVVAKILRHVGMQMGVPRVATADSHYPRREDAPDQRILLCSSLQTTLKDVQRRLDNSEDVTLGGFFRSSNYHIPTLEEMRELHTPDELANSVQIAARCETPVIGGKPLLPTFACPGGVTPEDYMRKLADIGWSRKVANRVPRERWPEYQARRDMEEKVLIEAGLASYFLIVEDYVRFAVEKLKCKVGEGRGSAAGSMESWLLGVTGLDPIKYDLMFERFYNAGRNDIASGRVALPDIDSDFPVRYREDIINYARDKYGEDKVCQMATYGRIQGRGALKDVLRAHDRCSFEEMNRITVNIPDEAAIADDLQEMADAGEEPSIIRWALENTPHLLADWCVIKESADPDAPLELDGPLALDFAQAMRLEGTKHSQGKHASGVIISSVPLADVAPMVLDKVSGQPIVGVDMRDAEEMGLVKFDILGTAVLDKIMNAEEIIRTGRIQRRRAASVHPVK